jgi:hypothetical protein
MRIFFLIALMAFPAIEVWAKSMRLVRVSDGDMETIFVEPGFSTLIKFDSHPQPGLIGDQDGFKVEYLKNMVAIKPLVSRGKTNLFLFTKDGQFNFQLLAGAGRHDNIVYAKTRSTPEVVGTKVVRPVLVDNLLTRKIGRAAAQGKLTMTIQTISVPSSRSTLVLKLEVEGDARDDLKIGRETLSVIQAGRAVPVDNLFVESRRAEKRKTWAVLLLLRREQIDQKIPLRVELKAKDGKPLTIAFSANLNPL